MLNFILNNIKRFDRKYNVLEGSTITFMFFRKRFLEKPFKIGTQRPGMYAAKLRYIRKYECKFCSIPLSISVHYNYFALLRNNIIS